MTAVRLARITSVLPTNKTPQTSRGGLLKKMWAKFAYAAKSAKAPAQNRTGDLKVWSKTLLPTDLQRSIQILACKSTIYTQEILTHLCQRAQVMSNGRPRPGDAEWQTRARDTRTAA